MTQIFIQTLRHLLSPRLEKYFDAFVGTMQKIENLFKSNSSNTSVGSTSTESYMVNEKLEK